MGTAPPRTHRTAAEHAALFAGLGLQHCQCADGDGCFRIVENDVPLCTPCAEGYHSHGYIGDAAVEAGGERQRLAAARLTYLQALILSLARDWRFPDWEIACQAARGEWPEALR